MPAHRTDHAADVVTFDHGYLAPRPSRVGTAAFAGGTPGCRGGGLYRLLRVNGPMVNRLVAVLDPVDNNGDSVSVPVPVDAGATFSSLASAIVAGSAGRVAGVLYPSSPVPGAPGLTPPLAPGQVAPETMTAAAKAAGVTDPVALDLLCRAAADSRFSDAADVGVLVGRVWKLVASQGASQGDAVRSVLSARFDTTPAAGAGRGDPPGAYRLVRIERGQGLPGQAVVVPIGGDGPTRKLPFSAGLLDSAHWSTFARVIRAAGNAPAVALVQPSADDAVPGLPARWAAPVPTSDPATAGPQANEDGMVSAPAAPAAMSAADLAVFLRQAEQRRHLELLSSCPLGRSVLPSVASDPARARAAAEAADRAALFAADPEAYLRRVEAAVAEGRRRELLSKSVTGRAVLAAEDAGGR